ncbi:MAG TPA: SpoIIE family protein phosphatase [Solirubrobacteraceae bacterium]|nr:SpoIIE family protein phosphatase [Solirubrobacteraceae bacterium]
MLAGDRPDQLRALETALAPLGYRLATATLGDDALRLVEESDVALVIVDAGARWRDGLETARQIKAQGPQRDLPILFLVPDPPAAPDPTGYWVGTVDYVLSSSNIELLRSKVSEFAELEASRSALKRSEALLRGAFEASPIGKTVLDDDWRIVRANRAFALLLDRKPAELLGTDIASIVHPGDRRRLSGALTRVAQRDLGSDDPDRSGFEVQLRASAGSHVWTCAYVSAIDPAELGQPLLMIQWVDLSLRRHAEQAHAELQLEQAAREQAEATAERLERFQLLTDALETLTLDELPRELALRLAEHFDAELAEVRIDGLDGAAPVVARAAAGRMVSVDGGGAALPAEAWDEMPLMLEGTAMGSLRLVPSAAPFVGEDRALLADLAERAASSIRRAQLHEQHHTIAATLQRGLLPTELPRIPGLELTAHYEPAGDVVEVGGDWYDAFPLRGGRVGIVLGDVAGKGIPAASLMGQLRSVTRAFALGDEQTRAPGDVLTRLNRYQLALASEEMFTVLYAIIDPRRGNVCWANAGHPPPLLHSSSSGMSRFLAGGGGLMGLEEIVYTGSDHAIGSGDTLIFYTDGLVERRGESLDVGLERLARAVSAGPDEPEALCRHVVTEVVPAERTPHDDVTIVLARAR